MRRLSAMGQRGGGRRMKRRGQGGFTFIEILMVIGIIGILVALLLSVLGPVRTRAKRARARDEVRQIYTAWTCFLNDYRHFPSVPITEMGPDTIDILVGANLVENPQKIIYMDFRPGTTYFCDPWGAMNTVTGVYHVALDAGSINEIAVGTNTYHLNVGVWSDGPDGIEFTDDDICSWRR